MPASENGPGKTDKALGMDQSISRRDFLNSTLLASGGLLMTSVSPMQLLGEDDDWTGYGGVGDYSGSNGNTLEVLSAGHRIRDGEFDRPAANIVDTGEVYDCVIVGGGISGLVQEEPCPPPPMGPRGPSTRLPRHHQRMSPYRPRRAAWPGRLPADRAHR